MENNKRSNNKKDHSPNIASMTRTTTSASLFNGAGGGEGGGGAKGLSRSQSSVTPATKRGAAGMESVTPPPVKPRSSSFRERSTTSKMTNGSTAATNGSASATNGSMSNNNVLKNGSALTKTASVGAAEALNQQQGILKKECEPMKKSTTWSATVSPKGKQRTTNGIVARNGGGGGGISSTLSPSPSSPSSSSISSATSVKTGIHQSEAVIGTDAQQPMRDTQLTKGEKDRPIAIVKSEASTRSLTSFAQSSSAHSTCPSSFSNGVANSALSLGLSEKIPAEDDDQTESSGINAISCASDGSSKTGISAVAVVRPKAPPPALPARPVSASEQLLQDIQNTLAQNSSPSRTRQSLTLDKIANPAISTAPTSSSLKSANHVSSFASANHVSSFASANHAPSFSSANHVSSFHTPPPPPPPRRFGNRWRGEHFLEIQEFSPIFEEPVILQNR